MSRADRRREARARQRDSPSTSGPGPGGTTIRLVRPDEFPTAGERIAELLGVGVMFGQFYAPDPVLKAFYTRQGFAMAPPGLALDLSAVAGSEFYAAIDPDPSEQLFARKLVGDHPGELFARPPAGSRLLSPTRSEVPAAVEPGPAQVTSGSPTPRQKVKVTGNPRWVWVLTAVITVLLAVTGVFAILH